MRDFAAVLVEARKEAGLTQTEVAAAAGLTSSYLSFLENRKKPPPSDDVCRRLAVVLKLPAKALLEPAHMERAPEELRARVERLTHSLHRERRSLRTFMEGLLSPFLFAGPPGYRESAIDALGVSPRRRRRIREAVQRAEQRPADRRREIRRFLDELSEEELSELAERLPHLEQEFLLDPGSTGDLKEPQPGDRVVVDGQLTPKTGDLVYREDGSVRRLEEGDAPEGRVIVEIRRRLR
ncbi:MAG: helix-turn-helix transcriptional regulator [Planctomycetota bacterium]